MISRVKLGKKEIVLVGTAHVSKKSIDLVKSTIKKEKPDCVAVELCEKRYESLKHKNRWKETEISKIIKEGKTYLFLANLILLNFQKKIGKKLGVDPGAEMLAAIEQAGKQKVKVALVDRDIQVTLRRALSLMGAREKVRLLMSLFMGLFGLELEEMDVEKLKEKDVLTEAINELAKVAPSVKRVLIDERDSYISGKIAACEGKKIVAVLGAGHLEGVKKRLKTSGAWKKGTIIELRGLEIVPRRRFKLRYLGYVVPVIFALLLGYGFWASGTGLTLQMLLYWFLINGILSAIGAAVALGHPLTILTAFIAAPFTSLNPALAAGWFAGYVEAKVRNPKVKDFESLDKLERLRDFWKNQITRILLVVAFANVGSIIGTFIALPYLISLL